MNLDAVLKKQDFLSSKNLLKVMTSKEVDNIESITFIPPKVGTHRDFGHFKVIYRAPYHNVRKKFKMHNK
ncbi:MAG: hypothetical protein IJ254_05310 [Succinivibrio sp.]|jgi:hypothetical protein|nr:hypothetical protein [Succinivibrio sp.]